MPRIRDARQDDAARLAEIYGYYVEHTAVTYEYVPPTPAEFGRRIEATQRRYPYLVIEEAGTVLGYAYAGPLVRRAAADWSCEVSIYLDRGARRHGLGRQLYEALEHALGRMGIVNLYALVACPEQPDEYLTADSPDFHARLGFQTVGRLHRCGRKFDRWYDLIWMEKVIGTYGADQRPVVPWPEVKSGQTA